LPCNTYSHTSKRVIGKTKYEWWGVSRDLVAKYRNSRDLIVKQNSPLIQNFNEEVTKIKVVEFFKSYNIALGFKFRNPKYTALILKFE
jgi:hypothetical protein